VIRLRELALVAIDCPPDFLEMNLFKMNLFKSKTAQLKVSHRVQRPALNEARLRHRHDEFSPERAIVRLVRQDLVGKVPGEQKHVVGTRFNERFDRLDRQALARDLGVISIRFGDETIRERRFADIEKRLEPM
jgi:hypothetical protein